MIDMSGSVTNIQYTKFHRVVIGFKAIKNVAVIPALRHDFTRITPWHSQ